MQSRGRMQIDRIRPGPVRPGYSSSNSPYNRSHTQAHTSYSHRNSKPLYPPSRKYEILLEAGRLATEYLVSTGVLPPNSSQRNPNTNSQDFKGPNGNYPDFKGQIGQNALRRFDDDYDRYRTRKNGRGKRQKGFYRKDSFDWENNNKGRNSNSNSRNNGYSDEEEEEEEYLRYRRERKETSQNEVGSRVSGSKPVKREGVKGESGSDLEDTGSKASSCSIKKDQTGEVSNVETGEISEVELEKIDNNNNNNNDMNNNDNSINNIPDSEPHLIDDGNDNNGSKSRTLLKYCEFAKIPTKPRSVANNNNDNNNRGQLADPNVNEEKGSDNLIENKENQENSFAQPIILEEEEEEMEMSSDQGKMEVSSDLDPVGFKTCDLNITGLGEITEIPDDPVPVLEEESRENKMSVGDFMIREDNNNVDNNIDDNNDGGNGNCDDDDNNNNGGEMNESDNVVQVIHIEDDSPAQPKENSEEMVAYQNSENILTNIENDDVMPTIQDGFNLTLSDYLGGDISCYPIQPDLQPGVMHAVDDPIYGSLGDIGFMWDQPTQDYERFF